MIYLCLEGTAAPHDVAWKLLDGKKGWATECHPCKVMLLEPIVQLFIEFLLEVIGGLILDLMVHCVVRIPGFRSSFNAIATLLLFFGLGVSTGLLSLLVFPISFIKSSTLPGISLVITPTMVGLTMGIVGWRRRRDGHLVTELESFTYGFVFAFGVALMRFALAD